MTRLLRLCSAVAAAALSLSLAGIGTSAAVAASPSTAGACTTDDGVTVVVDLSALGGSIVVRCVTGPLPSGYTGWDALSDAGFHPQAPTREPGFICRLAGEPSASRTLDIPENPDYHEQCVNTPPQSAYWGYWYATNGGSWTYSTSGASARTVVEGGYEGWAFALNSNGHAPKPGVAPSHPVTQPTQHPGGGGSGSPSKPPGTSGPTTSSPSSSTHPSSAPSTTGSAGPPSDKPGGGVTGGGKHGKGGGGAKPSSSAEAPSTTPTTATSTGEAQVTGEVPDAAADSGGSGSAVATIVGVGVLVLLGAGAGVTAWRRSHRS